MAFDERFPSPGVDIRFEDYPNDVEHSAYPIDERFPSPGEDTRFEGGYGSGPRRLSNPTVSPGAPVYVSRQQTMTSGAYAASGGGVVTLDESWLALDGVSIGGLVYTPVAGDVGKILTIHEFATETGGTKPGTRETNLIIGPVLLNAVFIDVQPTDGEFIA